MVHKLLHSLVPIRGLDNRLVEIMSRVVEIHAYLVKEDPGHFYLTMLAPEDWHEDATVSVSKKFCALEGMIQQPSPPHLYVFSMPEWMAIDLELEEPSDG